MELIKQIEINIAFLTPSADVDDNWQSFVDQKKIEELNNIIAEENLNHEETFKYIDNAFRDGYIQKPAPPSPKSSPQSPAFLPPATAPKSAKPSSKNSPSSLIDFGTLLEEG